MGRRLAAILWLLLVPPAFGSGKKWSDAKNMGFASPVHAATTAHQTFTREPTQPGGPSLVYPLFCEYCEFDRNGTRVNGRTGNEQEGSIVDEQGRVEEQFTKDETGEVIWREVFTNGPFGKVRSETYQNGKLSGTATFDYDSQGNMIDTATYKADGTLESHSWSRFDARGHDIEGVSDGPGDHYYDVIMTYDERTGHLASFTRLNRDGSLRLSLTMNDRTVLSYWQQPGDKRTYGSDVCFDDDNGTERDCREYNSDGTYATTHYEFTDKSKRNPVKVVLRGSDEQRQIQADYEYSLDEYGNWTSRTIWVSTRESGERRLLEKDTRTLTYYPAN